MFCSKCGGKTNETDRYCSLCGQENVKNKEKLSFDDKTCEKIKNVISIFSFVVAIGIVVFIIPLFGYDLIWWVDIALTLIIYIVLSSASSSYLSMISPDSNKNGTKKVAEKKENLKTEIKAENKEQLENQKKQKESKWKLILIGFFVLLFVKVMGSAFNLSTIYPKTISGWTEKEEQVFFDACRESAFSVSDKSIDMWHYAGLYCECVLEQTMILYPTNPPGLGGFEIEVVSDIGDYCLWKIGF